MMLMNSWWNSLSEGWQIAILSPFIAPTAFFVFKFLFKANRDFFKLLDDFQEKLPPRQKRAKESTGIIPYIITIDTTRMQMNLTSQEIDMFQKKLETFRYSRIIFKRKEIENYSNNLQRIISDSPWNVFGIAMIQKLIEDEQFERRKPYLFGRRIGKILGF